MSQTGSEANDPVAANTWVLHNPLKGWTLFGISAREARLAIVTLSSAERTLLFVTRTDKSEWFKLDSTFCAPLGMDLKEFAVVGELPEIPSFHEPESTRVHLLSKKREFRDRKFERVNLVTQVEFIASGHTFSTTTEDLSEGGLRVKDLLPDWVAGYFAAIVKGGEMEFEVHCSIVEDQKKDRFRVEVVSLENDPQYVAFCAWVKSQREILTSQKS